MSSTFYVITLGCKLNQYDSDALCYLLCQAHWVEAKAMATADIVIINSCTVTMRSDQQLNQTLKQVRKSNPQAFVVVAGCFVDANFGPDSPTKVGADAEPNSQLPALAEANLLVSNAQKYNAQKILSSYDNYKADSSANAEDNLIPNDPSIEMAINNNRQIAHLLPVNTHRTRSLVKIQDGCNYRCSYCIVPKARGRSRSVSKQTIISHLKNLQDQGIPEAILTGVHLSSYGLERRDTLLSLLKNIASQRFDIKIRLSSIDCRLLSDDFIDFLMSSSMIQPHLHISLQSASDRILKKMRRPYTIGFYAAKLDKIHQRNPFFTLGTDIICGFPDEQEQDFLASQKFLQNSPLHYAHIFSYSPRKGTDAYSLPGQLPPQKIKQRSQQLRAISAEKLHQYQQSQLGSQRDAIVLQTKPNGQTQVITDNYLSLPLVSSSKTFQGSRIQIMIDFEPKKGFIAIQLPRDLPKYVTEHRR